MQGFTSVVASDLRELTFDFGRQTINKTNKYIIHAVMLRAMKKCKGKVRGWRGTEEEWP